MDNQLKICNGYIDERDDEIHCDEDGVINDDCDEDNENKTYYPTCRFCGSRRLPDAHYRNQAEADEAATMRCDCQEAREYQQKKEAAIKREKNIIKIRQTLDDFTEYCKNHNVELDGKLYDTLFLMGISVLDDVIASASVKFRKMKVSINTNTKGNIVIAFHIFRWFKNGGIIMQQYTLQDLANFINTVSKNESAEISIEVNDNNAVEVIGANSLKIKITPHAQVTEPQLVDFARSRRSRLDDFPQSGGAAWRR